MNPNVTLDDPCAQLAAEIDAQKRKISSLTLKLQQDQGHPEQAEDDQRNLVAANAALTTLWDKWNALGCPKLGSPVVSPISGGQPVFTPRFAYVANDGNARNISAFAIEASGAFSSLLGSPFTAGELPWSIAVDPAGKFAYVANNASNDLSSFVVNANGTLTPAVGSPFAAGVNPIFVAVHPTGNFVYSANRGSDSVSAFVVNANSGVLTPVAGTPYAVGHWPASVAVHPEGKFLYTANFGSNNVSAFAIDVNNGMLTEVNGSPFAAGPGSGSVTVDPFGKFAFVANIAANAYPYLGGDPGSVSVFAIELNGGLSQVNGSPFAAGNEPVAVVVDPMGKHVLVANAKSNDVSVFALNANNGSLILTGGSPFAAGQSPGSVTVDGSGRFVYVANRNSDNVSAYTINANGVLIPC